MISKILGSEADVVLEEELANLDTEIKDQDEPGSNSLKGKLMEDIEMKSQVEESISNVDFKNSNSNMEKAKASKEICRGIVGIMDVVLAEEGKLCELFLLRLR
ncbi:hypothetical protein U1Q18_021559 [Sarracenia purpurea var. burkii]